MKLESLNDLFVEQLRDIRYAENELIKALEEMADNATDEELKQAFIKHRGETADQLAKLERVMKMRNLDVKSEKCHAIEGLLKEAKGLMGHAKTDEARDAALIVAAQKVEHYEMATYGSLCAFATRLGYEEESQILRSIYEQEKATDQALSKLAEKSVSGINQKAQAA